MNEPGFYTVDLFDCPNFRMFHNNDCPRAVDILEHKFFEPMSMRLWCHLLQSAGTVIDIGAHVGVYSLAAAALRPDVPIHAFEPNPDVFARLALHINLNGFTNIQPHRHAIAHTEKVSFIRWSKKGLGFLSSGTQLGEAMDGYNEAVVFVRPLDMSHKRPPIIMKIDVEGAEQLVFEGMSLVHRPDIILETFDPKSASYIGHMTKELGYSYFLVDEQNMTLMPEPTLLPRDPTGVNFNQFLTTQPESIESWIKNR
jgi:FkbM family methyltransferase